MRGSSSVEPVADLEQLLGRRATVGAGGRRRRRPPGPSGRPPAPGRTRRGSGQKMARNLARSSSGTRSSSARASTRSLKSSQDSSRLRYRCALGRRRLRGHGVVDGGCGHAAEGTGAPRERRSDAHEPSVTRRRRGHQDVVVLGVAEVPLEQDVLTLGVAHDPLAVAPELGVVRRQQHQAGHDPGPEVVDHLAVAEVGLDLPVRRHRAEVDDAGMGAGRLDFGLRRRTWPTTLPVSRPDARARRSRSAPRRPARW